MKEHIRQAGAESTLYILVYILVVIAEGTRPVRSRTIVPIIGSRVLWKLLCRCSCICPRCVHVKLKAVLAQREVKLLTDAETF